MNLDQIIFESYENYYFEEKVAEYLDKKIVNPPIYLSQGTTHIPVILKHILKDRGITDFAIFTQHRCHSYYLTFSQDKYEAMRSLSRELCGRLDGCGKGMVGSASLHIPGVMFGHDGLLGSNAPIACGYAQATQKPTVCILGDAACEEDYVLASLGYAATHKLPILFLVENNGLSILTDIPTRRSWDATKVAEGFGLSCHFEHIKDEWEDIYFYIGEYLYGPSLLEIDVCRHKWHAGSGNDGSPKWNSMEDKRTKLVNYFQSNWPLLDLEYKISEIWKELDG